MAVYGAMVRVDSNNWQRVRTKKCPEKYTSFLKLSLGSVQPEIRVGVKAIARA